MRRLFLLTVTWLLATLPGLAAAQTSATPQPHPCTKLVTTIKNVFTAENQEAMLAVNGVPVIRLEAWDAGYMREVWRAHPGFDQAFNEMLIGSVEAFRAMRASQQPTATQLERLRCVVTLAGSSSPERVTAFLTLIRDANVVVVQEEQANERRKANRQPAAQ